MLTLNGWRELRIPRPVRLDKTGPPILVQNSKSSAEASCAPLPTMIKGLLDASIKSAASSTLLSKSSSQLLTGSACATVSAFLWASDVKRKFVKSNSVEGTLRSTGRLRPMIVSNLSTCGQKYRQISAGTSIAAGFMHTPTIAFQRSVITFCAWVPHVRRVACLVSLLRMPSWSGISCSSP